MQTKHGQCGKCRHYYSAETFPRNFVYRKRSRFSGTSDIPVCRKPDSTHEAMSSHNPVSFCSYPSSSFSTAQSSDALRASRRARNRHSCPKMSLSPSCHTPCVSISFFPSSYVGCLYGIAKMILKESVFKIGYKRLLHLSSI